MAGEEDHDARQDRAAWKKYRTGARSDYDSIRRDARGYPLFVRATPYSKDWDQFRDAAAKEEKDRLPIEESSTVQRNDIFSATQDAEGRASTSQVPSRAVALPDPRRGKLVASFYSQLPREALAESQETEQHGDNDAHPQLVPRKVRAVKSSGADWFIRKASARLQHTEEEKSRASRESISVSTDGICSVCLAPLPVSLTAGQWDAHRSSITHQLAADGPTKAASMISAGNAVRQKTEESNDKEGRILLKPSNLGYTALERMGWRKGMGLGRDEWEYGERLKQKIRSKRSREDFIVISDSEDEEDDDLQLEIGSDQWLERVREEQARLAAARPPVSQREGVDDAHMEKEEGESDMRSRPLLEPIAVHLRPDRRGIGRALPASSRIVDGKKQGRKETGGGAAQPQKRLTKYQKKQLERQKQEEWKQLRSSLN